MRKRSKKKDAQYKENGFQGSILNCRQVSTVISSRTENVSKTYTKIKDLFSHLKVGWEQRERDKTVLYSTQIIT